MTTNDLDEILDGFNPGAQKSEIKAGGAITVWLPKSDKARYEKLQEMSKGSDKRFSEVVRAAICALIARAESKAS